MCRFIIVKLHYATSQSGRWNYHDNDIGDCSCNNDEIFDTMSGAHGIYEDHGFLLRKNYHHRPQNLFTKIVVKMITKTAEGSRL